MKVIFAFLLLLSATMQSQQAFDAGQKLYNAGQFRQAKIFFEKDLKENPGHLQSLEYLGDIQSQLQIWESALVYYQKLKSVKPREANYQYKYGGALAMIAAKSNKIKALTMVDEIELSFKNAIRFNPKHLEARWALVELYLQLPGIFGGSEKKATAYATELSKLSAVDGWLAKGRIAEYFERYSEAEKCYKKAIETGNSKTTYEKLSDLYKNKLNQPEKAKEIMHAFAAKS